MQGIYRSEVALGGWASLNPSVGVMTDQSEEWRVWQNVHLEPTCCHLQSWSHFVCRQDARKRRVFLQISKANVCCNQMISWEYAINCWCLSRGAEPLIRISSDQRLADRSQIKSICTLYAQQWEIQLCFFFFFRLSLSLSTDQFRFLINALWWCNHQEAASLYWGSFSTFFHFQSSLFISVFTSRWLMPILTSKGDDQCCLLCSSLTFVIKL